MQKIEKFVSPCFTAARTAIAVGGANVTTQVLKFPAESVWVSVYTDDDEAAEIWEKEVGVSPSRIVRLGAPLVALAAAACTPQAPAGYQGYVEGEFVNVASPIAGRLDQLAVKRGDDVAAQARLYALEAVSEAAAQRQAAEQVKAAEAQLADLKQRPLDR